jgi:hypothetical protein
MVRLQTLDLRIGVRVPASQPTQADILKRSFDPKKTMRTLALSSLLLVSGILGLAQDSTELLDKAPPPVDEALRARIDQYYHAFVAGKFKDAYLLVADDSQDAFLKADKDQYKACETIKIRYSDNFTKAIVVENCKGEWKWHGTVTPTSFPLTTNWEVADGKWYWRYVRPTMVASPFSPTGFVPVPPEATAKNDSGMPANIVGAAEGILSKIGVDKRTVHLRSSETSQDVVHVRNDMPGTVTLKMEDFNIAGLKITVGKTQLQAHEETTILFEWRLDDPAILCPDCAKRSTGTTTLHLHISPTGQAFPIDVVFDRNQQPGNPVPPQVPAPTLK